MLSYREYRLGTVNDLHWGFKPGLSLSKPHSFTIYYRRKKLITFREILFLKLIFNLQK